MVAFGNARHVVYDNSTDLAGSNTIWFANLTHNLQCVRYTLNLTTADRGRIKPTGVLHQGAN